MNRVRYSGASAILGLLALVVAACSADPRIDECKGAIELHLKSPGSAAWGELETEDNALDFDVRGRVDSDNSYGASGRNYFICRFKEGERVKIAFSKRPFADYKTRLRTGQLVIDWR